MNHDDPAPLPQLRDQRLGLQAGPYRLDTLTPSQTPWHEDHETIQHALAWGRKKAKLLLWVRSQMVLRLTAVERRCIELYYFQGLNYREAAAVLGVNASSVYRAVQRGLRKLREAARQRPDLRL